MASPELFPSNTRQSCRVYSELPHLHLEISHLLEPESDEEDLPPYPGNVEQEGGEVELIGYTVQRGRLGRDNSISGTEHPGQSGSKDDVTAVWYRRTSSEDRSCTLGRREAKDRASVGEQDTSDSCTTDV